MSLYLHYAVPTALDRCLFLAPGIKIFNSRIVVYNGRKVARRTMCILIAPWRFGAGSRGEEFSVVGRVRRLESGPRVFRFELPLRSRNNHSLRRSVWGFVEPVSCVPCHSFVSFGVVVGFL